MFLKCKNVISKQLYHTATLLIEYLIQHEALWLSFSDERRIFSSHQQRYEATLKNITDPSANGLGEKTDDSRAPMQKASSVLKNIAIE